MNELMFQKIMDKLQEGIPENWSRMLFYASYTSGSFSMKYYVDLGSGEYEDCYNLANISKAQLAGLFMGIDKDISAVRNMLDENNRWNVLTLIVNAEGDMKADFDYQDISEISLEYEEAWKRKYLK